MFSFQPPSRRIHVLPHAHPAVGACGHSSSSGCYLSDAGENLTGTTVLGACIDVRTGKAHFLGGVSMAKPGGRQGFVIRTNLVRRAAGWRWVEGGRPDVETLVSLETRGGHHYCLYVEFKCPLTLAAFPEAKSEPRLRPTAQGTLSYGRQAGWIGMRGRMHPVFETICVR